MHGYSAGRDSPTKAPHPAAQSKSTWDHFSCLFLNIVQHPECMSATKNNMALKLNFCFQELKRSTKEVAVEVGVEVEV